MKMNFNFNMKDSLGAREQSIARVTSACDVDHTA